MRKATSTDPWQIRKNAVARRSYQANPERFREKNRKRRRKAIDRGKCGECIGRQREPGLHTCYECLEKHRKIRERKK